MSSPPVHSRAPWAVESPVVDGRAVYYVVDANGMRVAELPEWRPEYQIELEANARLISAAPELLAALKRASEWVASHPGEGALREGGPWDQAREAIAKATRP